MIQQTILNGDTIIAGRNGSALVSSKSQPGGWHCVRDGRCDCRSFAYREHCRHVRAVAKIASQTASIDNPNFAMPATLADQFNTGPLFLEGRDWAVITDGEHISFAEWQERRANQK